jgi:hypothetical protein
MPWYEDYSHGSTYRYALLKKRRQRRVMGTADSYTPGAWKLEYAFLLVSWFEAAIIWGGFPASLSDSVFR